jgi:NAD(P)-dependent dehydrogenase (short-subunit alcohol dehydrogenase family)
MGGRPSPGDLAGWSALVTGGSRGIGRATAVALASAGARVVTVSRTVGPTPVPAVLTLSIDLASPDGCDRAVAGVRAVLGEDPDILVNNAGMFALARVEETDPVVFDQMVMLNLTVPFRLARAFLPAMRARRRGHVVTIGSIADHVAFPENGAYSASKFGARGMHEVLREELRGSGVRATLVSPGAVDTPLWDAIDRAGMPGREAMISAESVADAVVYAVTRPAGVAIEEMRLGRS